MIAVIVRQLNVTGNDASGRTVTVTDTLGNTYTQSVASTAVSGSNDIRIFYAKNILGGANTVTATFGSTGLTGRAEIVVWEVAGLDTTAPEEDTTSATGNSTTPSAGDLVTAGGGFLLAGFVTVNGYRTPSAGSGWTGTEGAGIWAEALFQTRLPTAGGTYTANFGLSPSADDWTAVAAAFKDAAGGGSIVGAGLVQPILLQSRLRGGLVR